MSNWHFSLVVSSLLHYLLKHSYSRSEVHMFGVLLTHSFHLNKSGESFCAPKAVEFPLDFVKYGEDMTRERERTKIISRWHPVSCQINSSKEQAYQQRRNQTLERKVWHVKVIHWLLQCGWPCGSGEGNVGSEHLHRENLPKLWECWKSWQNLGISPDLLHRFSFNQPGTQV